MATWAFYSDAGLTTQVTEAAATTYPTSTLHLWFGSTTTGVKLEAASNPGTDNLAISIVDSATGSGHAASAVKLAATYAGLSTASGGAALTIGTSLNGGTSGAFEFYASVTDAVGAVAKSTELSLSVTPWVQSAT